MNYVKFFTSLTISCFFLGCVTNAVKVKTTPDENEHLLSEIDGQRLYLLGREREAERIGREIDLHEIQSAWFHQTGQGYIADVDIVFRNESHREILMENFKFTISIEAKTPVYDEILLGRGVIERKTMPSKQMTKHSFGLEVGPDNQETRDRLLKLINVLANPSKTTPVMHFRGNGDVGVLTRRGWVIRQSISVDLEYTPKLMETILLK